VALLYLYIKLKLFVDDKRRWGGGAFYITLLFFRNMIYHEHLHAFQQHEQGIYRFHIHKHTNYSHYLSFSSLLVIHGFLNILEYGTSYVHTCIYKNRLIINHVQHCNKIIRHSAFCLLI
jgi:hypothetical protein